MMSLVWCQPLAEPVLAYNSLDPWEQISLKFASKYNFCRRKWICKCLLHMVAISSRSQCVRGFNPSALRAGGVLSSRSGRAGGRADWRAGGCQTCGTHISVTTWWIFSVRSSMELSRPVVVHCHAHLPHMGLPMGQKLVKFATNWVQTLRIAYLWNRWMDLPHLKFHGLV